jgi:hypothetical protein
LTSEHEASSSRSLPNLPALVSAFASMPPAVRLEEPAG